ncbi:hypothetical protein ACVWWS_003438 [Pseudomonas chlororaphis]
MGTMERYAKVGMQELDQRLSKIVEAARKKPVSVYRYGAPWVWIVSQDDWQGALKEVSSYIPPGHSLVLLRPQIDALLDQHRDILQGLDAEPGTLIAPRTVMHIRCPASSSVRSDNDFSATVNAKRISMKTAIWFHPTSMGLAASKRTCVVVTLRIRRIYLLLI